MEEEFEKFDVESGEEDQNEDPHNKEVRDYEAIKKYLSMWPQYEPIPSEDFKSYIAERQKKIEEEKEHWIQKLKQKKIYWIKQKQYDTMEVEVLHESINQEILVLAVRYGKFLQYISLLNIKEGSPAQEQMLTQVDNDISNSKVMSFAFGKERIAVKRFSYETSRLQEKLLEVVKEVFMLKIAEALETGPKVDPAFLFDILIFKNVIEFPMEFCLTQQNMLKYEHGNKFVQTCDRLQEWLWQATRRNHMFNIMHLDIKNQNIGFSLHFGKYVFIDYGLTEIVKEQLGQKTSISYRGSIGYSSPEMLQACTKNNSVDLYYNDVYGLKELVKTFNIKKQILLKKMLEEVKDDKVFKVLNMTKVYFYFKLKYAIYFLTSGQNINKILSIVEDTPVSIRDNILTFWVKLTKNKTILNKFIQRDSLLPLKLQQIPYQNFHKRMKKVRFFKRKENEENIPSHLKFPSLKSLKVKSEENQKKKQKQKSDVPQELITCKQFSNLINLCSQCLFPEKVKLCQYFLEINKEYDDEAGQECIKKVSLFIYELGVEILDPFILNNVFPAIILMELIPEQKLISDMNKFLEQKESINKKLIFFTCWITNSWWIDAKLSSRYNRVILEKLLIQHLQNYLANLGQIAPNEEQIRYFLDKLYFVSTKFQKISLYRILELLNELGEWYQRQEFYFLDQQEWLTAIFSYILFRCWYAAIQLNNSNKKKILSFFLSYNGLQRISFESLTLLYYSTQLFQYFVFKNDKNNYNMISSIFKKHFQQYSFYPELFCTFQMKLFKEPFSGTFLEKFSTRVQFCIEANIKKDYLFYFLFLLLNNTKKFQAKEYRTILQQNKLIGTNFQELASLYPLSYSSTHNHELARYLTLLYEIGTILYDKTTELNQIKNVFEELIEDQECQLCQEIAERKILNLDIKNLVCQGKLKEAFLLGQSQLKQDIQLGNQKKVYESVMSIYSLWLEHPPLRKEYSLMPTIFKIFKTNKFYSTLLNKKQMFFEIYFYIYRNKGPQHTEMKQFILQIFQCLKNKKDELVPFMDIILDLFVEAVNLGLPMDKFAYNHIQNCLEIIHVKNPYLAIYVVSCFYQYYRTDQPFEMYLKDKAKQHLIFFSARMMEKLPVWVERKCLGSLYYELVLFYARFGPRKTRILMKERMKCGGKEIGSKELFKFKLQENFFEIRLKIFDQLIRKFYQNFGTQEEIMME